MTKLSHLWLLPNQCCSSLPPQQYRRMLLLMLPSLQVIDTKLIDDDEKEVLTLLTGKVERLQAAKDIQKQHSLAQQRELRLKQDALGQDTGAAAGLDLNKQKKKKVKKKVVDSSSRALRSPTKGSGSSRNTPSKAAVGISGTSELMATMTSMLPNFEPSAAQLELLGKPEGRGKFVGLVKREKPKHSNGVTVTTTIKCRAALCDPKAHLVEYEGKYPGSSMAVVVHHDGSAIAKWPGEQLAISVDSDVLDHATSTSNQGTRGSAKSRAEADTDGAEAGVGTTAGAGGLGGKKRYSLFASYRSTRVTAVSFDMEGNGFVNLPNGQALLSYNAVKDSGVQYNAKGEIVRRWSRKDATSVGDSVEVVLDMNLAFRHRLPDCVPEVYFACNTVRHKLVQGFNPPMQVWEDENDPNAPSFLPEMNKRNPLGDAIPKKTPTKKKKRKMPTTPTKSPRKAGAGFDVDVDEGPGVSLASISSLTLSLTKLNSDLLNGSILKS